MSTFQPQQQQQPQTQPQPQQQQQPVLVYPNPVPKQPTPVGSSHHSDGSFGTVFIILAVIVVVSAIACLSGRLCGRKVHNQKPKQSHKHSRSTAPKDRPDAEFGNRNFRPRDQGDVEFANNNNNNNPSLSRPKEGGDIEFGFDSKRAHANGIKTNGGREGRGHVGFENVNGNVKHHGDHHHHDGGPTQSH